MRKLRRPRTIDVFLVKNEKWMEMPLPAALEAYINRVTTYPHVAGPGRPQTNFDELSARGKRKRTEEVRQNIPSKELVSAARSAIFSEGSRMGAQMMDNILASPSRPKKMKKALEAKPIIPYEPDEALAYMLDTKQTQDQYMKT
jgi:hypothetical protein